MLENKLSLILTGLFGSTIYLSACSNSSPPFSPIPESAQTISQIYESHTIGEHPMPSLNHYVLNGRDALHGYSRDVYDELSSLFIQLPNPTLVLYIFPHLSDEGAPYPGHSTLFEMYESTEYALPNEVFSE